MDSVSCPTYFKHLKTFYKDQCSILAIHLIIKNKQISIHFDTL